MKSRARSSADAGVARALQPATTTANANNTKQLNGRVISDHSLRRAANRFATAEIMLRPQVLGSRLEKGALRLEQFDQGNRPRLVRLLRHLERVVGPVDH